MTNSLAPQATTDRTPDGTQIIAVQPGVTPAIPSTIEIVGGWAAAVIAIAGAIAMVYKLLTRELGRDVADLKHRTSNNAAKIAAIEHQRVSDIERVVRLETTITNIERGLDRVEGTINDRFDTLAESIREIRVVAPR